MAIGCPVGYTCSSIDEVINQSKEALSISADIRNKLQNVNYDEMSPSNWQSFIDIIDDLVDDVERAVADIEGNMEDIRSANSSLRDWGEELHSEVEELEAELQNVPEI